jgi:hypothetical protein
MKEFKFFQKEEKYVAKWLYQREKNTEGNYTIEGRWNRVTGEIYEVNINNNERI